MCIESCVFEKVRFGSVRNKLAFYIVYRLHNVRIRTYVYMFKLSV